MIRRLLVIGTVAFSTLVLVMMLAMPSVVEHAVGTRIQREAESRGVQVQWADLNLALTGLSLTGVRIIHPRFMLRIAALDFGLDVAALINGELRLRSLAVSGLHGSVYMGFEGLDFGTRDILTTARPGDSRQKHWLQNHLFDSLPYITIEQSEVRISRAPGQLLGRVHLDAVELRHGSAVHSLKAFGWVHGFRDHRFGFQLTGNLDPTKKLMSLKLEAPKNKPVLLNLALGPRRSVEVGRLHLESRGTLATTRVSIEKLLARGGGLEMSLSALEGGLEGGRIALRGNSPIIRLAPQPGKQAENVSTKSVERSSSGAYSRLDALLSRLDLHLEKVTLEVPGWPRVTNLEVKYHRAEVALRGVLAGGAVEGWADWPVGWARPLQGRLSGTGVHLAPFFAGRGFSVPPNVTQNRRIDGTVDFSVDVWNADVHLERPLGKSHALIATHLSWHDGHVEHPAVAETAITGINFQVDGIGVWHPKLGRASWAGDFQMGSVLMAFDAEATGMGIDPVFRLDVDSRELDCQSAFGAMPKGILGPYSALKSHGLFAPRIRFRLPMLDPMSLTLSFRQIIRSCIIDELNAVTDSHRKVMVDGRAYTALTDVDWLLQPFSLRVLEGVDDAAEVWVGPGTPDFVPLDELPPFVGAAAYLSEEMNFYKNRPIDPGLITRGLKFNLAYGRFVYGGSTVTQQLVKNLFLTRRKTIARKIQEIIIATKITQVLTRERVLELYLNCIEFGPNVYGIGSAARYYFGKDARSLSPMEAVFLAMLKPAPWRGTAMMRRGHTPKMPYWSKRAEEIIQRMVDRGYLTQQQADAARPHQLEWSDGTYVRRQQTGSLQPQNN